MLKLNHQSGGLVGITGAGNQSMMIQRQQALVLMCRVYVGSIYYDLKEEIVRGSFNPFGPIKSINMSFDPITGKHKGFAFIEYETPDAAQLALEQMQNALLGGRSIKVGRPSNMPQSHPIIDKILEESKSEKRIYVSSVHQDLTVDDLRSVFSAFGNILSCTLSPDTLSTKHKGYGFVEYDTVQSAHDAISSMNMFDLGGQYLRVGRAIAPPGAVFPVGSSFNNNPFTQMPTTFPSNLNITTAAPVKQGTGVNKFSPANVPPPGVVIPPPGIAIPTSITKSKVNGSEQKTAVELPNMISSEEDIKVSGSGARNMIMQKLMRKEESRVMMLLNMVDADEVDEALESEVTEECLKYGEVSRVIIYQEKQGEEDNAPIIVKIFVEFPDTTFSKKAIESLNGRWFGGRKIEALSYSQKKFDSQDYSA